MSVKSDLNDAISRAHEALEEFDRFDLDSSNPVSVIEMDNLNREHEAAVAEVVRLVKELYPDVPMGDDGKYYLTGLTKDQFYIAVEAVSNAKEK